LTTAAIALCLVAGFVFGQSFGAMQAVAQADGAISILLYIMLFFVGMELGMKGGLRKGIRALGFESLVLPALVAAGSIGGGLLAGLFIKMKLWQGAAVGAGFGWYSLSSVMLARFDPALGAVAFLSNILRELLALLFIPLISRYIHPWAGIAAGGATAMDTTLPVVVKASGSDYAIHSFISGVILSIMVPVTISAILAITGVK
jgi:uncharacterized membrane protein YbjE (DUF340 family)